MELTITVLGKGRTAYIPFFNPAPLVGVGTMQHVVIFEGGTQSGEPSVLFGIGTSKGKFSVEVTGKIIESFYDILQGIYAINPIRVEIRRGTDRVGGDWKTANPKVIPCATWVEAEKFATGLSVYLECPIRLNVVGEYDKGHEVLATSPLDPSGN